MPTLRSSISVVAVLVGIAVALIAVGYLVVWFMTGLSPI